MSEISSDASLTNGPVFTAPNVRPPEWFQSAAHSPLPGHAALKQFEPPWGFGRHYGPPAHDAAPAAVLALLYPVDGRIIVPVTVRHDRLTTHAGQISLPGGRIDANESDWDAALRELVEELGVTSERIMPIAPLSPLYIFATNYYVRPWLAWSDLRPTFTPNPAEVADVLEVPLDLLRNPASRGRHRRVIRGLEQDVPHFAFGSHCIWGATAMILSEIVALSEGESCAAGSGL